MSMLTARHESVVSTHLSCSLLSLGMTIISHSCFSFLSRTYFKISALWFCFSKIPQPWMAGNEEGVWLPERAKASERRVRGSKGKSCRLLWLIFICLLFDIILLLSNMAHLELTTLRMLYPSWIIEVVLPAQFYLDKSKTQARVHPHFFEF